MQSVISSADEVIRILVAVGLIPPIRFGNLEIRPVYVGCSLTPSCRRSYRRPDSRTPVAENSIPQMISFFGSPSCLLFCTSTTVSFKTLIPLFNYLEEWQSSSISDVHDNITQLHLHLSRFSYSELAQKSLWEFGQNRWALHWRGYLESSKGLTQQFMDEEYKILYAVY